MHCFFGHEWRAPLVLVVLAAFGLGCAFGIFAMVPSWWRHRRLARNAHATRRRPAVDAAAGRAGASRRRSIRRAMDFDLSWLLWGLPLAFVLGWLASRLDLRQLRVENRAGAQGLLTRA